MKPIKNPFMNQPGYNCFGCAPHNPWGLHLECALDEETGDVVAKWTPHENFQSWVNTLHGGIQATLLDEICCWVICEKYHCAAVTSRLEMKYIQPVSTVDGDLFHRARDVEVRRQFVTVTAELLDSHGEIRTKCKTVYRLFTAQQAPPDNA